MSRFVLESYQARWIPQRPRGPSGESSSKKQGCDRSSGWANPAIGLHHTSHSTWSRRRKPGRPSHLLHCSARDVGVHVASAQVVAVHPAGSISPYKSALWQDVFTLMKERLKWEPEPEMQLHVFAAEDVMQGSEEDSDRQLFDAACSNSDVFLAVDMKGEQKQFLDSVRARQWPAFLVLDSDHEVEALTTVKGVPTGSLPPAIVSSLAKLPTFLPWAAAASSWGKLRDLWKRRSSDDLAFMLMLAVNDCVAPVPSTQVNMGDAGSLVCMVKNCREEILACVQDKQCKAALDALAECGLNDQVCSYRVIASYESPLFENFSKCILQRHNCLGNKADIPMVPDPVPLAEFRGAELTWDAAEDIFIGHLSPQAPRAPGSDKAGFSWRVACGKNPAYDFFPCQFQLWYRAKGKGVMWYDPIFKVYTLDGREVWLRRHYRVRRANTPGAFYFSVLDNGVTSKEYWKIMDCDEQMQWVVFYYSGAATAAGITYRGALICTQTGKLPEDPSAMEPINVALARCGIQPWEMFGVDNSCCSDAPLSVPDYGFIDWRELAEA